jgi:hypothetical protein
MSLRNLKQLEEFLALGLSKKIVQDIDDAIEHPVFVKNKYSKYIELLLTYNSYKYDRDLGTRVWSYKHTIAAFYIHCILKLCNESFVIQDIKMREMYLLYVKAHILAIERNSTNTFIDRYKPPEQEHILETIDSNTKAKSDLSNIKKTVYEILVMRKERDYAESVNATVIGSINFHSLREQFERAKEKADIQVYVQEIKDDSNGNPVAALTSHTMWYYTNNTTIEEVYKMRQFVDDVNRKVVRFTKLAKEEVTPAKTNEFISKAIESIYPASKTSELRDMYIIVCCHNWMLHTTAGIYSSCY